MDDWREVLHKEVHGIIITASIKNNKVMVRIRDDVNLFTFKNAEEAILKINKIKAAFETFSERSVLESFLGPLE
ncbi:hypothetical protein ACO1PF_00400 [Alkalibacterium sp. f15]|uniref:hypothetical protein n=1 Tax=Alkalibacterium sp. f15 TaxID=3414029 RepID=UPI003BF7A00A